MFGSGLRDRGELGAELLLNPVVHGPCEQALDGDLCQRAESLDEFGERIVRTDN